MKPYERVAGMLLARRWTLAVLGGAQPSSTPVVPRELWERFLAFERCAAVLLERLTDTRTVPANTLETLRSVAAAESQSFLRARAEGHELSTIASRLDFPVIVLKGGVRAVAGVPPALPLTDIDILVDPSHVRAVTSLLREAGFGELAAATRHHHAIKPSADRLSVEVHWTTNDDGAPLERNVWNNVRPIPGVRSLLQLGAVDNIEYMLRHAVSSHCDRSVALRDVILAGACALDCDADEIRSVRSRIQSGRHAAFLDAMLDMSLALGRPTGAYPHDPFEDETAAFYAATVAEIDSTRQLASPSALAFITEMAVGRTSFREAPARAYVYRGSGNERLASLADRYPGIVRPALGVAHAGYYGVASALLLPRIRGTARKALEEIGPRSH